MTKVVFDEEGAVHWGPVSIELIGETERAIGTYRALRIRTPHQAITVYVSPTGRSIRVFRNTIELVAPGE